MKLPNYSLTALGLACAILLSWCFSALYLGQSPFAPQRSSDLLHLGAVDGSLFTNHEWWRVVTSQFLHVYFLHMLFNVGCIAVIGVHVATAYKWHGLLIVYFVGGSIGQYVSVAASPALVSSGASQALMAICAAAILISGSRIRYIALVVVALQAGLDLYASGAIKIGHSIGFVAGLLVATSLLLTSRSRNSR